jgi:hypothetical protein
VTPSKSTFASKINLTKKKISKIIKKLPNTQTSKPKKSINHQISQNPK